MYEGHPKWGFILTIIFLFVLAPSASAATYYIAANGSDSNTAVQAQSKSTPWLHAPGMGGCTAKCAAYTPQAGDRFIFRGGDTWHLGNTSSLTYITGWGIRWSGTSGNPIYIGVDKTWCAGGSWTRPILNGDGADFSSHGSWVYFDNVNYVMFDNFEFTGMYVGSSCGYGGCNYLAYGDTSTHITVEHCYFHGWSHGGGANDNMTAVLGDSHNPTQNVGCVFAYNVVDGSDSTNGGDSGAGVFYGPPIIHHNYITNVSNGLETMGTDVHDNTIGPVNDSFDGTAHENGIEQLGSTNSGANYYYNNVLYSTTAVNFWAIPNSGATEYVFNNVFYDTDNGNVFNLGPHSALAGTINAFNNTIECGPDSDPTSLCIGNGSLDGTFALNANNNHLIGGQAYSCLGADPCNTGPNDVFQSKAQANSDGYKFGNKFAPQSGSAPTVGTGANLTSTFCTSMIAAPTGFGDLAAAKAACQKDTTLGVAYDAADHTVVVPGRPSAARPMNGLWDVGAYQYAGRTATVNPPTGLTAAVN
jgi:hypothetical protein